MIFPSCGAPDGKCDNFICALKLVTREFSGSVVQSLAESSNNIISEAL